MVLQAAPRGGRVSSTLGVCRVGGLLFIVCFAAIGMYETLKRILPRAAVVGSLGGGGGLRPGTGSAAIGGALVTRQPRWQGDGEDDAQQVEAASASGTALPREPPAVLEPPPPAASSSPASAGNKTRSAASPSMTPLPAGPVVGIGPSPSRAPGWAPEQRPLPASNERSATSHAFEEATAASMNPPPAFAETARSASELAELRSRLVIGLGMGVHSGGEVPRKRIQRDGVIGMPLFHVFIPSLLARAQPHHIYRLYLGFDHNDAIFESATWRSAVESEFARLVAAEDAARPHPPNYVPGTTVDSSTLLLSLHWVHCDFAGKPSWAHSDAVMAAYKEGADYVFRSNDDTQCPDQPDWVDRLIVDLRGRDIPNLGVVGPQCDEGPAILTHDFTHRTHALIFGFEYPRSLPNWSSDDWVTYVYDQFGLMHKLPDVRVKHLLAAQRYESDPQSMRLRTLNAELANGASAIAAHAREVHGKELSFTPKVVTCC